MWFRMETDEVERRFLLLWLVDGEGEAEEIHRGHDGIAGWQDGLQNFRCGEFKYWS